MGLESSVIGQRNFYARSGYDGRKIPSYVVKLQSLFGENNWVNVVRNTANLMFDLGQGGALTENDFRKMETEVLILRGSEDKMVSAESSVEVAGWLKNGSYKEIEGAPHPLEKVDVGVLAIEITRFCGKRGDLIVNLRNLYFLPTFRRLILLIMRNRCKFVHIPQIKQNTHHDRS